ncbi:MAG: dicarboxylate/amino acid:cation symporter [Proteobacteria bacterium]|nr:dicarboxylate/amino acid:cation symporter [Pseudomonadota bacterium]
MAQSGLLNTLRTVLKRVGLPLFLLLILVLPLYLGPFVSVQAKATLYSISLTIKEILLFLLPFIIFSFIFSSLLNLKSGVLKFILTLVGMIFVSNCTAIFTGFTVGSLTLTKLSIPAHIPTDPQTALMPLWSIKLPKLIGNQYALIIGFALGIIFSFKRNATAATVAKTLHHYAILFLKKVFIPLLPIFILGFVFKLEHDHLLAKALKTYGPVCLIVVSTQVCYMLLLYFIVANFSFKRFLTYLKNVLPATITGFSTLSSAATMPVLILCTEKNLKDPEVAEIVIPATINTHTLGSALGITILSLTTLLAFGHHLPTLTEFVEFGFLYALAKFAVAAVPGGAIIVVTPLLEAYLHFSSEMIGLITAIYMLFDPFGTATNVTGNGFFTIAFSKIYKFNKVTDAPTESLVDS